MQVGMAAANYFQGNFTEAAAWAEKSVRYTPDLMVSQAVLAASQAMLGKQEEASITINRLKSLSPSPDPDSLLGWLPTRSRVNRALMAEGLRKAGFWS